MDTLFEIEIDRTATGSRDSSQALYAQLKAAIGEGRLSPGAKLPATRQSKAFFGVARNTAADAYERLLHEGYVVTRRGSGTYVADRLPAASPRAVPNREASPDARLSAFWVRPEVTAAIGFWREPSERSPESSSGVSLDFRPALVDSLLFPHDVFRRVSVKQLRKLERKPASLKSPQGNQGHYPLREAVSRHISLTRGVACEAEDIVVTSGAQQAFDLLARALVTPGKTTVALEDPGYPPMRVAFAAAGAKLVPVGVDEEGLIVDQLPADVGVICVCPSHQFPLGITMSARRRTALVEFARSRGAVIVEDDYDGEFRYEGSPLQALRTTAAADVVCYVGTFSKCMLPSLRLGFIVAPGWAMQTLVTAKNCLDWHSSTPVQLGVAAFVAEGHLTHHVRKMRVVYKDRRRLLLNALHNELAPWLEPIPSFYGMHVAASASASLDLDDVTERLLRHNVKIHTFSRYYLGPQTRRGLVFGYGAVDLEQMSRGLSLLHKTLLKAAGRVGVRPDSC